MGRTAQPAALKLIKGRAPGKDSAGRDVNLGPKFKRVPPEPPEWLSPDADDEWHRVVPGLARLDLLKPEDRAALAAYCEAWALFVKATKDVQHNGLTIENHAVRKDGSESTWTTANPAVAVARNAGREMRSWAAHFGLTPSTEQALARGADDGGEDESNPFA